MSKGRRARHRLVFDVPPTVAEGAPEEGDLVRLTVPAAGLRDFFDNEPASDYQTTSFNWSSAGALIVDDQADPRLEDACVKNGKLQLSFSETPDMALASTALLVDGAPTTWTLLPDGYTLEHNGSLATGSHTLGLTQEAFDLAAKVLSDLDAQGKRTETFEMPEGGGHVHVYNAPLPGEQTSSTLGSVVGNVYGFQGLPFDEETGFLYVRHRYYDPQMGRFIQTDPYGYADAPNLYQYALGDPVNNSDPTGEIVESAWDAASLGIGIWSFSHNVSEGNFGEAVIDAIGITVDTVALAVPFLPGGAGVAMKAARAASKGGKLKAFASAVKNAKKPCWLRYSQVAVQALDVGQGAYQAHAELREGNYGWAALNATMAVIGARGLKQGLPPCKLANCFAGGTPVLTEEGERPIEEIEVGDRVWAWNEGTGERELAEVVRLFERERPELVLLHVGGEVIETTDDHPFWVVDRGWTEVDELEVGDVLWTYEGRELRLDAVERQEGSAEVYNFEARGLHTYFVGTGQVLVHNCDKGFAAYAKKDREIQREVRAGGNASRAGIDRRRRQSLGNHGQLDGALLRQPWSPGARPGHARSGPLLRVRRRGPPADASGL